MILLRGISNTQEYKAAELIKNSLVELWPDVENATREEASILIISNCPIGGYKVGDFDIIVLASFKRLKFFRPNRTLRDGSQNMIEAAKPVGVKNFVSVIEVKSHDEKNIEFKGEDVWVKYSEGWKSATEQNKKQVQALRSYFFDRQGKPSVFVMRSVLLLGLNSKSLASSSIPGLLTANLKKNDFMTQICSVKQGGIPKEGNDYVVKSCDDQSIKFAMSSSIFQEFKPSSLDRKKMDQIIRKTDHVAQINNNFGSKFSLVRGVGGTGKTIALLQSAWASYKEQSKRTLFLTYNHALSADVTRLKALMGVPSDLDEGGISICTVMSFMYRWLTYLGVIKGQEEDSFANYQDICKEAIELIRQGAITPDDIVELKSKYYQELDFDNLVIDEGQDWPSEEVELLKALYDIRQICVADGVQQLVRGLQANWFAGVKKEDRDLIHLDKSLRMKSNLSSFIKLYSNRLDTDLTFSDNTDAAGGRVLILKKPYNEYRDLHSELTGDAKKKGNAEIDFLFCVPPADVTEVNGDRISQFGMSLKEMGLKVWDGTNISERKDFPRDLNTFRVVQYDSCRGLEGWVVVLEKFDEFIDLKYSEKYYTETKEEEMQSYVSKDDLSKIHAHRWALMALSRPIDTLVISLSDLENETSRFILDLANQNKDFVEIL